MVDWKKCFPKTRLGKEAEPPHESEDRSEFEVDYDRIVFSAAFRRMQDKTQVIPLPESDFVHTRLTHSLEASCVGRSLGKIVGVKILKKYPDLLDIVTPSDFAAIVASACLAHDIGNPPFGHSGEDAIREYFLNGNGKRFEKELTEHQWQDLTNFEGNASGFRLLVNLKAKLSYSTLAAFTKYPRSSKKKATDRARRSQKKYGFFESDSEVFQKIAGQIGLPRLDELCWIRHPLAFLVEAADDICYHIIDFEDGARLGLIPIETAHEKLKSLIDPKALNEGKLKRLRDPREQTSYLRALAINAVVHQVAEEFCRREAEIRSGEFDESIIDVISSADVLKDIKKISFEKYYRSPAVLKIEAAGFSVIGKLLDLFINGANDIHEVRGDEDHTRFHSAKLMEILPNQFLDEDGNPPANLYDRIMSICEFVCGMTDSYAVSMYRKLTGIEIE